MKQHASLHVTKREVVIFLAILSMAVLAEARPALAATFSVTNTNASGPGSLDQAIQNANANNNAPTIDTIRFAIPASDPGCNVVDVCFIAPGNPMPHITEPVTIDGYTQPGASPATSGAVATLKVVLTGVGTQPGAIGLHLRTSKSTIKGLTINRWAESVRISGADATGNVIAGNHIGTDVTGTQAAGSTFGVGISGAPANTIGGTTPAARNVISGNQQSGIGIFDPAATGNRIVGNRIGTDAAGSADLGNLVNGVFIYDGARENVVGGVSAEARNVISGNDESGVALAAGATGNRILGNYIGTDRTGTADLGNLFGVRVDGAANNTIGGTDATDGSVDGIVMARNVISGNGTGIFIGLDGTGTRVVGNYIGTNRTGTQPLANVAGIDIFGPANTIGGTAAGARNVISANQSDGVRIGSISDPYAATENSIIRNFIGTQRNGASPLGNGGSGIRLLNAFENTIGGGSTAANVIAFNGEHGVSIDSATTAEATGNLVLANSVHDNGDIGIDLGDDGVTPNDPFDGDTGPNRLQNFPVLSSATVAAGKTTIQGTLNSVPVKAFTIQFFSSPAADPSGHGEGARYLGQRNVTTDASGNATFLAKVQVVTPGHVVTATATRTSTGDTSEFSAGVTVS